MKIALIGYGKMGRMVEEIARERGHEIVSIIDLDNQDVFGSEAFGSADVAIEFTSPTAAYGNYVRAWERGVKIIGATSHYVTAELDAGPIIEQDVTRITHKDTPESLVLKGKDLEKIVLSHAVSKHIQRKILTYKNKTIIFS